jgi:hypothetical protein
MTTSHSELRIRSRKKLKQPLCVLSGDFVQLTFTDRDGVEHVVIQEHIGRAMTMTEGVIFDTTFEGRDAIGGLFVAAPPFQCCENDADCHKPCRSHPHYEPTESHPWWKFWS